MAIYFAEFEFVWIAWVTSGLLSLTLTVLAANRLRWRHIRSVVTAEDGAAYTLSYLMTVPLYVIMVCAFVETSLMLIAKIGTVYSAYAGARTMIVWDTAADQGDADEKSRQSAIRTMAPFASGLAELRKNPPSKWEEATDDERAFLDAYQQYSQNNNGQPAWQRYVRAKYGHANRATDVTIAVQRQEEGHPWDEDVSVTVAYDFPFKIPVIGRLLGTSQDGERVFTIASTAVLHNECPRNEQKRLGIGYASAE